MISQILRDALAQIMKYERDHPEDARSIAPGLFSLKFQIHAVLQYIERPTMEDLEDQPEIGGPPLVGMRGTRH